MDEIDVKILRRLKDNARENASVISEKVFPVNFTLVV